MALGKEIKRIRKLRKLTQNQLSSLTGGLVSQGALSNLEKRDSMTCKFQAEIADALGVTIRQLHGLDPFPVESEINAAQNNITGFSAWLTKAIREFGLNPTTLAYLLNENQPTIQRVLSGETKNPGVNLTSKIESLLQQSYALSLPKPKINTARDFIENEKQGLVQALHKINRAHESAGEYKAKGSDVDSPVHDSALANTLSHDTVDVIEQMDKPSIEMLESLITNFSQCDQQGKEHLAFSGETALSGSQHRANVKKAEKNKSILKGLDNEHTQKNSTVKRG